MIYLSAFFGSLLFIAIKLKMEKQKSDDNPKYHLRWGKYFSKEWDDFAFTVISGQALVWFQHDMFFGYATWKEWDMAHATEFYEASEYALAGCMGLFGAVLILLLFKYVVRKANKLADD